MEAKKKETVVYMRPSKVLEKNPKIKKKWSSYDIGYLLKMQLIRGYKLSRGSEVAEIDVINLFKSIKNVA